MQEKVEIITNHIVNFWTILDKNTQKRILWVGGFFSTYMALLETLHLFIFSKIYLHVFSQAQMIKQLSTMPKKLLGH